MNKICPLRCTNLTPFLRKLHGSAWIVLCRRNDAGGQDGVLQAPPLESHGVARVALDGVQRPVARTPSAGSNRRRPRVARPSVRSRRTLPIRWVFLMAVPHRPFSAPLRCAQPDPVEHGEGEPDPLASAAERPRAGAPVEVPAGEALDALAETAQDLSHAATMQDVQRVVRTAARRLTAADGATLVLRDGDECFYADEDAIEPLWKGERFPLSTCISGWSMLNGEAAAIEDIYADDRIPHDAYRETFVKSLLMVPIVAREPIGAIGVYWARQHLATESQIALVRALAASTAVALEHARMGEQLTLSAQENARLSQEVERRRSTEEDLRELCERDALTGLLNRRAWDMSLTSSLRKRRQPMYVALIDLDHFKAFNDRHGHPAGDALLRRAAVAWRSALRTADVLARYGGEEFAILLAGCSAESALEIIERVREATVDDQSVSIGLATWDGRESAESLVYRADKALYQAKHDGRNRVVLAA
jgi:diguanylate cyclase (GGDEF)-like protein